MWKWLLVAAIVGGGAWSAYDAHLHAVFDVPEDMPDGAWTFASRSGFRAILIDIPDDRENRAYRAYPNSKTPEWFIKTWATCRPISDAQLSAILAAPGTKQPGLRWEALCEIEADGDRFVRGWIASTPRR